ncbi:hypothetical protein JOY44_19735 [Phormidium sp. CLA17]|uniref:hypothetical protein n=1 Tax=Leptolyngbya sp. Cla-17 TaxID=2803751 RepID=UPI0014929B67|nr:hypothetical protein [Leptolyngbya sp. Cla-17]MBM0743822.1 hypothetical protein [Leptolyngbya sp. Cla-17]
MNKLLIFLSQPIIITLLSLLIGSYLFTLLAERRAKREKSREKAIQLIEEVGNDFNAVFARIIGRVRLGNFNIERDSPLNEKRGLLFTKRFSVRIKSEAYLRNKDFWKKYDYLVFEIDKIITVMKSTTEVADVQEIVKEIRRHQQKLFHEWTIDEDRREPNVSSLSDELEIWHRMIWDRAVWLLSTNLKAELR